MILSVYKTLITVLFPLLKVTYIKRRQIKGKEHPTRFNERLGNYTHPRPEGKLYWFHGASVGESISMLPLIEKLLTEDKTLSIIVTTGTLTSAEIMQKRLPERAFHQFISFDTPKFAKNFLTHFKPDAVLWFESELWPSYLSEIKKHHIPLILVNGRISDKSFKNWRKFSCVIKEILSCFTLCLGQSEQDKERLTILGAKKTACFGNIKYAGSPLPKDPEKLTFMQNAIKNRPVFLISSTHHNEEELLGEHFAPLKTKVPNVLIIIVPRHPHRGEEILSTLKAQNYAVALRSKDEPLTEKTEIYIADTIGEMGLWYALSSVSFIGGSLIAHGGQNFIEPARDKNAVIVGPHMHNFKEMLERAQIAHAITQVATAKEVIDTAIKLFSTPTLLETHQQNAYEWTVAESKVLDGITTALKRELEK